jgi:hypothetical protein
MVRVAEAGWLPGGWLAATPGIRVASILFLDTVN